MTGLSRRDFVQAGTAAAGGLLLAFYLPGCRRPPGAAAATPFEPNAWLRIAPDETVTVIVAHSEMGQGVLTSLPMLVAEELDADWAAIRVEQAPATAAYAGGSGMQMTGGSSSVRTSWEPLRRAGATARRMLIVAAAQEWEVEPDSLLTQPGMVVHPAKRLRATYGSLVGRAASVPVPQEVPLKDPKDFRIIGRAEPRVDGLDKVTGRAIFGLDVRRPGLLTACIARCPVFGGRSRSYDATAARAVPGVRQVVQVSSGIAVIARGYWAARKGVEALQVTWDEGPLATLDSEAVTARFQALARRGGTIAHRAGNPRLALRRAAKRLSADYELPYLAHATMEPMNCTADVRADGADLWVPTQFQQGPGSGTLGVAAKLTGLPASSITVHTTLLGGGFGRRAETDFVTEAVECSKAVQAPVMVVWSREDDMRHDFYRPASYHQLAAGLDRKGAPVAWTHRIVSPSIMARWGGVFGGAPRGADPTSVEGAANLPYAIPALQVDYVQADVGVPVGFWRSVGNSQNAFVVESFVDELAHAAGADPVEWRRGLLAAHPRHLGVLELAAEKAGWGTPAPQERARGVAVVESFGSYVAQIAEVSVGGAGVQVHRVVCAVDCGQYVNPDTIRAQMEGAIVFGLTAALYGEITLQGGRVVQGNFDGYPLLRLDHMPVVEVHIVQSSEAPGGVGEPGTPPIAPAVANAVFAATGRRIRRLPLQKELAG